MGWFWRYNLDDPRGMYEIVEQETGTVLGTTNFTHLARLFTAAPTLLGTLEALTQDSNLMKWLEENNPQVLEFIHITMNKAV